MFSKIIYSPLCIYAAENGSGGAVPCISGIFACGKNGFCRPVLAEGTASLRTKKENLYMVEHNWLLYTAAFACAFAITLVATPFAKWLSIKWGAIDYPKDRGVHKEAMPRMGGIAIVLGFVLTVLMVYHYDKSMNGRQLAGFLTGALLIAGLGMLDDIKNLPAKLKFCVQILAALIVIFSGVRIQVVLWPVTAALQKFSVPITLVWIVGLTNAVNLIDGLDGLAAGVSSIAALSLMVLCIMTGSTTAVALTAAAMTAGSAMTIRRRYSWVIPVRRFWALCLR